MAREPGSPSATVLPAASVIVGEKGALAGQGAPAPSFEIEKLSCGVPSAPPLHGVRSAVAVWLPQSCGLLRIAVGPPRKLSANDVNGTCGRLSNTVVSWPLLGSGVTVPGSLIFTPDCSMSTNRRSSCVGVG